MILNIKIKGNGHKEKIIESLQGTVDALKELKEDDDFFTLTWEDETLVTELTGH